MENVANYGKMGRLHTKQGRWEMKLGTQIQTGLWDSITHSRMETLCCHRVWGAAQDSHGSGPLNYGKP